MIHNYRLTPLRDISENKKRIIEQTRKRMQVPPLKTKGYIRLPMIIAAFTLFVALFLGTPYLQQAFFNKYDFTIEKVIIPGVEYSSFLNSTYIDETNEFVYSTEKGFYSFDVKKKESTLLVDTSEIGSIYGYYVSPKWLIWSQPVDDESKPHILNRQTGEIHIADVNFFYEVALQGDTFIYAGDDKGESYFYTLNLNDFTTQPLHLLLKTGSSSGSPIEGNKIAIVNEVNENGKKETLITVYDFVKHEQLGSYTIPYKNVQSISLKGDKIYGYIWDTKENNAPFIGVIDLNTNEFNKIKSKIEVNDYATDGEHFAVAVKKNESDSVQLFDLQDGQLQQISKLNSIKERLVKPIFTEQGTLVVNGEGSDHAMYLIRFEK